MLKSSSSNQFTSVANEEILVKILKNDLHQFQMKIKFTKNSGEALTIHFDK